MSTFKEIEFGGEWWEIARYKSSQPLEAFSRAPTLNLDAKHIGAWDSARQIGSTFELSSINFTGQRIKWAFTRTNVGFFSINLSAYDPALKVITRNISGVGRMPRPGTLNILLDDNGKPKDLGNYDVIYTDYVDICLLGKPNLDVIVLSRRFSIPHEHINTILILTQRAGYDASRLYVSHPSVLTDARFIEQPNFVTTTPTTITTRSVESVQIAPLSTPSVRYVESVQQAATPASVRYVEPPQASVRYVEPAAPVRSIAPSPPTRSIASPPQQSATISTILPAISPLAGQLGAAAYPQFGAVVGNYGPNIARALTPVSSSAPELISGLSSGAATPAYTNPAYIRPSV